MSDDVGDQSPAVAVVVSVVATGASLWAAPRVGFDYNLLNLQANGTESVVWERKAAAAAGRSVFAALSTAPSRSIRWQEVVDRDRDVGKGDQLAAIVLAEHALLDQAEILLGGIPAVGRPDRIHALDATSFIHAGEVSA